MKNRDVLGWEFAFLAPQSSSKGNNGRLLSQSITQAIGTAHTVGSDDDGARIKKAWLFFGCFLCKERDENPKK
jgi:hypothetical protein